MNILQVNEYYLLIKVKSRTIEQATFEYTPLEKAGEKQIKTIEDEGRNLKKVEALKLGEQQKLKSIGGIFPKKLKNNEIKNELNQIKKL